ncbi:tRNA-specific adenosine deaminase [Spiroplasma sp. TIUS-1]|uniref:nucleoside deaminase n=1 Tax=Spiroplasma sp. TIUS-1 TaxID=216963 RepID=UPI0013982B85|nr:nucleoside deaminase [Spiroplasma sp. TIUS-1]QHX35561.1 tRNA-specific adenosine deaminase [Spiroplasma sp. TIUS-1]
MDYFKELYNLLDNCDKSQDIPVSALLVNSNSEIVAKSYNTRKLNNNISEHAEINVINELISNISYQNLSEYTLYTTLKPCTMCTGAIEQVKIRKVFYYVENKFNTYESPNIEYIHLRNEKNIDLYVKKLQNCFKKLR